MSKILLVIVGLIVTVSAQAPPAIKLASGSRLVEAFRNEGMVTDKWILDNDELIIQSPSQQTIQLQSMFPPGSSPRRIIRRGWYERYNGGMFRPIRGEDIHFWGIESSTRSWIANTNEIPVVKMGIVSTLNPHVGRKTIWTGQFNKHVVLQKSLLEIDNRLEDRDFIVEFIYSCSVGTNGAFLTTIPVYVEAGKVKMFSPSLTKASESAKRPVEWMSFIKAEGKLIP